MKSWVKTSVRLFVPFLLLFLLLITSQDTSAQTKTFYWERFDVDMTLLENGDIRVVETQTLNFSGAPFTFGFATIPTGSNGNNDGISDIRVSEGGLEYTQSSSNQPGTFEVTQEAGEVVIDWYFEPALGSHTYTFSYTVNGGVIVGTSEEGDGDQIFWKAIPGDLPARVESSTVTIDLPEGVQPQQYTGTTDYLVEGYVNGEPSDIVQTRVSDDGRTITYDLIQPLPPGAVFEVRVQFPHGLLTIPTPNWQVRQQRGDVGGLVLLVIALLILVGGPLLVLLLWYTAGRDPETGIVVPEYITEPPDDLPPAVAGSLIDERADMSDIVSTLVDLANRGYLTMAEEKKNHTFARTDKSGGDLRPFEQQFLKDIFGSKQERSLNTLRYKFASKLPQLRRLLYQELVDEQLVGRSPESVRNTYTVLGWFIIIVAGGGFFFIPTLVGDAAATGICPPIALGFTGVLMLIAARFMPAKTQKGAEVTARWLAFKNYLRNVEQFENLEEASEIFGKYLAYATAFGLERTWINKFASIPNTPVPPWYFPYPYGGYGYPRYGGAGRSGQAKVGAGGAPSAPTLEGLSGGLSGGLASMSAGLTRMLNSTSTVLKSTPPSSNSRGGFSGGFSGGSSSGGGSRGFG